jgi:hypothetical protein
MSHLMDNDDNGDIDDIDKIDYKWTCGGDKNLKHEKLIAYGGYGQVHEVTPFYDPLCLQFS